MRRYYDSNRAVLLPLIAVGVAAVYAAAGLMVYKLRRPVGAKVHEFLHKKGRGKVEEQPSFSVLVNAGKRVIPAAVAVGIAAAAAGLMTPDAYRDVLNRQAALLSVSGAAQGLKSDNPCRKAAQLLAHWSVRICGQKLCIRTRGFLRACLCLSLLRMKIAIVRKPYTDRREYRYLSLSNKMRVLLITDSSCDDAAASIRVAAGSAADPPELPGLAHFTEHMLFQGSQRYPHHTDYFDYIHRHGGSANAYTSRFSTVFSFAITPAFLLPALERMADAFAAPLLNKAQMDKEVHAVHAEYQVDINDDARRAAHLVRQ
ncbi:unnamed protein product, partial [Rangifer tarandus platyrhynchus]